VRPTLPRARITKRLSWPVLDVKNRRHLACKASKQHHPTPAPDPWMWLARPPHGQLVRAVSSNVWLPMCVSLAQHVIFSSSQRLHLRSSNLGHASSICTAAHGQWSLCTARPLIPHDSCADALWWLRAVSAAGQWRSYTLPPRAGASANEANLIRIQPDWDGPAAAFNLFLEYR
jgi:hypothetical protein